MHGKDLSDGRVKLEVNNLLSDFICSGGFALPELKLEDKKEYSQQQETLSLAAETAADYDAKK